MNDLENVISGKDLSSDEINEEIKKAIKTDCKHLILKYINNKDSILEGFKLSGKNIKLEIIGDAGNAFANYTSGLKVIANGNIGLNSALLSDKNKFTVLGNCGENFGCNSLKSEFYIYSNCGKNSFSNVKDNVKVVAGGVIGSRFATSSSNSTFVILNLPGGNIFLDDNDKSFEASSGNSIYLRGKYKLASNRFLVEQASNEDEDIYLPSISEFARLFKFSLAEIKSMPFYRVKLT